VTQSIQRVAVVGAGYMGGGIAQTLAMAGLDVVIVDADPALTRRHLDRLCREAEDFEGQGLFDAGSPVWCGHLRAADSLPGGRRGDLIEEAVLELPEIKGWY
jgi:3-hydroxybutyryl-CoA dehydrogenase